MLPYDSPEEGQTPHERMIMSDYQDYQELSRRSRDESNSNQLFISESSVRLNIVDSDFQESNRNRMQ